MNNGHQSQTQQVQLNKPNVVSRVERDRLLLQSFAGKINPRNQKSHPNQLNHTISPNTTSLSKFSSSLPSPNSYSNISNEMNKTTQINEIKQDNHNTKMSPINHINPPPLQSNHRRMFSFAQLSNVNLQTNQSTNTSQSLPCSPVNHSNASTSIPHTKNQISTTGGQQQFTFDEIKSQTEKCITAIPVLQSKCPLNDFLLRIQCTVKREKITGIIPQSSNLTDSTNLIGRRTHSPSLIPSVPQLQYHCFWIRNVATEVNQLCEFQVTALTPDSKLKPAVTLSGIWDILNRSVKIQPKLNLPQNRSRHGCRCGIEIKCEQIV